MHKKTQNAQIHKKHAKHAKCTSKTKRNVPVPSPPRAPDTLRYARLNLAGSDRTTPFPGLPLAPSPTSFLEEKVNHLQPPRENTGRSKPSTPVDPVVFCHPSVAISHFHSGAKLARETRLSSLAREPDVEAAAAVSTPVVLAVHGEPGELHEGS